VGGIGVKIDTTVENGCGILADSGCDECLATRVVLNEVGNIVNNTSDGDEGLSVFGFCDEIIPANNWKLLKRCTPV
jgi:hypothetical protein